jgi:L-ascorbate metabolism protein UlaG (beta-lactamase superfamily)
MRITKFGHACVRIEHDAAVVVVDPGVFSEPEALAGATGVLITHEHADHVSPELLRGGDTPIWTIEAVARLLRDQAPDVAERVVVVRPGERLDVCGLPVEVVGEKHAVIHPDYDRFDNSGYVVTAGDRTVYHPGDALTAPGRPVDLLLAPVSAPWLKVSEAIDFVREVGAPRSLGIHDKVYSDIGLDLVALHMGNLLPEGQEFVRRQPGEDL